MPMESIDYGIFPTETSGWGSVPSGPVANLCESLEGFLSKSSEYIKMWHLRALRSHSGFSFSRKISFTFEIIF